MAQSSRRRFLSDSCSVVSAFGIGAAFSALGQRFAYGEPAKQKDSIIPINDEVTGLPLLRLPEGFRYRSFGWTGDLMSDGTKTPGFHDGMAVIHADGDVLNDYGANEFPQRVFALTQDGQLAKFAESNIVLKGERNKLSGDFRTKEWAGASFSPDGKWLFINNQVLGITFAITGPWSDTFV